jgi:large subunit ribosomal protein L18
MKSLGVKKVRKLFKQNNMANKKDKVIRRHKKIRSRVSGNGKMPRLSVSKSNRNIIVQLIDDSKAETIAYVWTKLENGNTLKERSKAAGNKIAELAKSKKITKVVFDRGGHKYIGNIKELADAARESGLKF